MKQRNENTNPAKLPKPKSKYCKFLKGPHVYGEWKQVVFSWSKNRDTGLWERFCVRCNRKDWWSAPWLEGKFLQHDPNARPPGYGELQEKEVKEKSTMHTMHTTSMDG